MKAANLKSIINAHENLSSENFSFYLKYFGLKLQTKGDNDGIRKHELSSLSSFVTKISDAIKTKYSDESILFLDNYFFGYRIDQINKEFDLLRLGENEVVNIELKSTDTGDKIKKQLVQNRYYLSFLQREMHLFSYVADSGRLFQLQMNDGNEELVQVDVACLCKILYNQKTSLVNDINSLFNPLNYLVSPFNSTSQFIRGEYFLTKQQEEIKKNVLGQFKDDNVRFVSITGGAGTGKSLLVYDIAKDLIGCEKRVIILHCAGLNGGQLELNEKNEWNIFKSKDGLSQDIKSYDVLIVDEAQRISNSQFEDVIQITEKEKLRCIFSYDENQCLSKSEITTGVFQRISEITLKKQFALSGNIRTNKEIISFTKQLLDKNRARDHADYSNIELCYCRELQDTSLMLKNLYDKGWKIIQYTPLSYGKSPHYQTYQIDYDKETAHSAIGQEYDNVVAVLDEHFYYDSDGKLSIDVKDEYYSQKQMLYQILTRARRKLFIIVINNEMVIERCLKILH